VAGFLVSRHGTVESMRDGIRTPKVTMPKVTIRRTPSSTIAPEDGE